MKIILAHKYFFRGGGTATYLFALRELRTRDLEPLLFWRTAQHAEVAGIGE